MGIFNCLNVYSRAYALSQWFPTGVPRHTRVPGRGVRGAAKYLIYYLL